MKFLNKIDGASNLITDPSNRLVTDEEKTKISNIPANPKYTDTTTTINGKTGTITKADIVALGIPTSDTNTTYTAGTGITLTGTAFAPTFGTTAGTVTQGSDSRLSNARTPLAHNHAVENVTNLQSELDGKLPLSGKDSGSLQIGRTFNNVASFEVSATPIEIVIKTKIPYISSNQMPTIHLQGYAYGLQAPIEIKIAYYIYAGNFTSMGAVSLGAWKPEIKLFSYLDGGTRYVAVALIGSIYYPRFSVNLFDLWQGTTRDYSQGWTVEYATTGSIIGVDNLATVPYKSTFSQTINGVAFNGTSNITIADSTKEPAFTKNTGFNKAFGTTAGTVAQGNDSRFTNARTPVAHTHTKANITDFPSIPSKTSELVNDTNLLSAGLTWGQILGI